jgi:hypothetical protein
VKPFETAASEESGGKPLALQIGLGDHQRALQKRIASSSSGLTLHGSGYHESSRARFLERSDEAQRR